MSMEVTPSSQKMVEKLIHQRRMSQHLARIWLLLFTAAVQSRQCKCIFLVILSSGSSQLAPTSSLTPHSWPRAPDHTLSRASVNKPTNRRQSWHPGGSSCLGSVSASNYQKVSFFYRTCASAISYKRCRNKNVFACLCTRILAIPICQTL